MRARALALVALLVVAVSGCGNGGSHSPVEAPPPRTVAQVEQAFAKEGIQLQRALPVSNAPPQQPTLFGPGNLAVEVYPSAAAAAAWSTMLLSVGTGTPHTVAARNVVAKWTGKDRPAVRAAVARLE